MSNPKIKVAFATGIYSEFGYKGGLPWAGHPHQSQDFKAFKEFTSSCVLVMGRHTFESLPCKLPNRHHIVISGSDTARAKNGDKADVYCNPTVIGVSGLQRWLKAIINWHNKDVCVIGGANLVRETLDFADEIMYTRFQSRKGFDADVFMPLLPKYMGEITSYKPYGQDETFMDIIHYRR